MAVSRAGEVVLSLSRLNVVDPVDMRSRQIRAGAGATISALRDAARRAGLDYGVDLASRDSATIGGTIATNAGGLRVIRYGDTRGQLVGIEAVLGNGDVVSHLSGLTRDNTGYHFPSLLAGSEGTLGVVTRAQLRLVPMRNNHTVALVPFDSVEDAVHAAAELALRVDDLEAVELLLAPGLQLVCDVFRLPAPFGTRSAAFLLVESAAVEGNDDLAAAVVALPAVEEVAVAIDAPRRAALWRYRDLHTEAIATVGTPLKLDVAVPMADLAAFIEDAPRLVAENSPGAVTWIFGHVAEGNVHVNVTGVDPEDQRIEDAVYRLVASYGGSISVEHGIGTAKLPWLHLNRTASEVDAFRALKRALDPDGIFNPGVLIPSPASQR